MNKILYLIPGFLEKTTYERYSELKDFLIKEGFKIIPIEIDWKRKNMNDYVKEFISKFNKHNKNDDVYVLGFSFGAMISFISSSRLNIKSQFLCSLSPYFKEDIQLLKKWRKQKLGERRLKAFNELSFNELSKNVKCKTYIFYGTKEGFEVKQRAQNAKLKIFDSELFTIKGAKHDLSEKEYIKTIKEVISKANG